MNWADFLHADCDTIFWLDKHCILYIWLSNAGHCSCTYYAAGESQKDPMKRIYLSFGPAICLGVFLEFDHEISQNFSMVLETLTKLCMAKPDLLEKNPQNCPKN